MIHKSLIFSFWTLFWLCAANALGQPRVSVEVSPPPAPKSVQKDINEVQKHRATYERGKNLLTAPALTAPDPPQEDPTQERREAVMERRRQFNDDKLTTQKDRKEKIDALKKRLDGEAEKIKKAEEARLKKRQQKIVEEAQAEREQKELAQEKRHNDIMNRAQKHRKKMALRKRDYNERKTSINNRRHWKPTHPGTAEPLAAPKAPAPEAAPPEFENSGVHIEPAPGVDINFRSEDN